MTTQSEKEQRMQRFLDAMLEADGSLRVMSADELAAAFVLTTGLAARIATEMSEVAAKQIIVSSNVQARLDEAKRSAAHVATQCRAIGNGAIQWCNLLGSHIESMARIAATKALSSAGWTLATAKKSSRGAGGTA